MNRVDFLHPATADTLALGPQPGNVLDVVTDNWIGFLVQGGYDHRPHLARRHRLVGFRVNNLYNESIFPNVMAAAIRTFGRYGLYLVHSVGVKSRNAPGLLHQVRLAKTLN